MNNNLLIFLLKLFSSISKKIFILKQLSSLLTNRKNAKQRFLHLMTEDMGFEPTHAFTRLLRFQHSLLSLLSNLP